MTDPDADLAEAGDWVAVPSPVAGDSVAVSPSIPCGRRQEVARTSFSVYVHVPYCATRCGYCDFNTYTAAELGTAPGASRQTWHIAAAEEIRRAAVWFADQEVAPPAVSTVFFGGGTPTLLPPESLVSVLRTIDEVWGLAAHSEVTTEANPDSVDPVSLASLREGGFTRVSFGMQSAVGHVLQVLDRTHTPGRAATAVAEARAAGFDQVSLDLIYGSPGESLGDWETSLRAALDLGPDHVSAYNLILEPGTRLTRAVRDGRVPLPDDDLAADMYDLCDEMLTAAGMSWYELSNWSTERATQCRHNLAYWRGGTWWGVGPGAHSHVAGVRWWNVKHPGTWSNRLRAGQGVTDGIEVLDEQSRWTERVMLQLRLADGLPLHEVPAARRAVVDTVLARSLATVEDGCLVLTRRGRLLADAVVRDMVTDG